MPYRIPACAGKPYRPSNGTEGDLFDHAFCSRCVWAGGDGSLGCPIWYAAFWHQIGDREYPSQLTHNEHGEPMCLAFEERSDGNNRGTR